MYFRPQSRYSVCTRSPKALGNLSQTVLLKSPKIRTRITQHISQKVLVSRSVMVEVLTMIPGASKKAAAVGFGCRTASGLRDPLGEGHKPSLFQNICPSLTSTPRRKTENTSQQDQCKELCNC